MRNELTDALAHYIHMLIDGDTHQLKDIYALLQKHGYADKDGFEMYPEGVE